MAAFTSPDEYQAVEDVFAVRAGRSQVLDVLSNDMNVAEGDSNRILVVGQPICGDIGRVAAGLEYRNSDACGGQLSFTYCVPQGDTCPSTTVTLNVSLPEALDGRPQIATSAFPTLRAPALAAPADQGRQIAPAQAIAGLRVRPDQPTAIGRPSMAPGSGMTRQQSAGVQVSGLQGGFGSTLGVQTDTSGVALRQPVAAAPLRAVTPQLGAAAAPSLPQVASNCAVAPRPVAPSLGTPAPVPAGAAPQVVTTTAQVGVAPVAMQ